jgi:hypothetical protein
MGLCIREVVAHVPGVYIGVGVEAWAIGVGVSLSVFISRAIKRSEGGRASNIQSIWADRRIKVKSRDSLRVLQCFEWWWWWSGMGVNDT